MKKYLLLFFASFLMGNLFSQTTFSVYHNNEKIESGAEINITKAEGDEYFVTMESGINIINDSDNAQDIYIKQIVLETPEKTEVNRGFSFCFAGTCEVNWNTFTKNEIVAAKSAPEGFHLSYNPAMDVYGIAKARYEIYIGENNSENPDYFTVTLTYNYQGVTQSINKNVINELSLYQQANQMSVVYDFATSVTRSLSVYSITGQKIGKFDIYENAGTFQIPITFSKGIYVIKISENNKPIATRKFIIQ